MAHKGRTAGAVTTLLTVVGVVLGTQASAQSAGFDLRGQAAQTLQFSDERTRSVTSFGLSGVSLTRAQTLSFNVGARVILNSDDDEAEIVYPTFNVGYDTGTRRVNFGLDATLDVQPVEFVEIDDDLTLIDQDGVRLRFESGARIGYNATPTVTLNAAANVRAIDFSPDDEDLVPSRTYTLLLGANRALTSQTGIGIRSRFRIFDIDDGEDTDRESLSFSANINHRANNRVTADASAGVVQTFFSGDQDDGISFTADAGLALNLDNGAASIRFVQDVQPTADGELDLVSAITLAYRQQLNTRNSFDFRTSASQRTELGGDEEDDRVLTFAPSFSRQLTERVRGNVGYQLVLEEDEDPDHRLRLTVSRNFDF